MNKWQLTYGNETITIIEKEPTLFVIETTAWWDNLTKSLWFPSYQSARNYCRKEMHLEGRFKKVIS